MTGHLENQSNISACVQRLVITCTTSVHACHLCSPIKCKEKFPGIPVMARRLQWRYTMRPIHRYDTCLTWTGTAMLDIYNLHLENIKYCPLIAIALLFRWCFSINIRAWNRENTVILCMNGAALTLKISFPMTRANSEEMARKDSFHSRRSSSVTGGSRW